MNVRPNPTPYGGWQDLGARIKQPCVLVEGSRSFRVEENARFTLERVDKLEVTLRWADEWGKGSLTVSKEYWGLGRDVVGVEVTGPTPGSELPKLTIESEAVNMCFR